MTDVNHPGVAERHLKSLIAEYLKNGDTLTAGSGLLGNHQLCYTTETEAYHEMRRCQILRKGRG